MRYSTLALWLFALSVLLPQGVGLPLPAGLPNLDLPRLAVMALGMIFVIRTLTTGKVPVGGAPRTMLMLLVLMIWQVISAYASGSTGSMIWAVGNGINFWGFAFASLSMMQPQVERDRVIRMLFWLAAALAIWSVMEMVTQQKLFPVRNLWIGGAFSPTPRRQIPGMEMLRLPSMSIGPYSINLTLGGALCTLGGFLALRLYKSGVQKLIAYSLLITAVLATQSRAAILALLVMLPLFAYFERRASHRLILLSALIAVPAVVMIVAGPKILLMIQYMRWDAMADEAASGGSGGARLLGLQLLFEQLGRWWLYGLGPGSLADSGRVGVAIQYMSDAGHLPGMFVESGLLGGTLLWLILLLGIRDGAMSKNLHQRAAAVGLVGYFVTAMISVTPWNLGIALVLAGLAESWSRQEKRERSLVWAGRAPATIPLERGDLAPGMT